MLWSDADRFGREAHAGGRRRFGWARAVRSGHGSGPNSREAPHDVFGLREKTCPDRPTDRYKPALDGFYARTDAGGLRVGIGDALIIMLMQKRSMRAAQTAGLSNILSFNVVEKEKVEYFLMG